jgi:hypothetical protein
MKAYWPKCYLESNQKRAKLGGDWTPAGASARRLVLTEYIPDRLDRPFLTDRQNPHA